MGHLERAGEILDWGLGLGWVIDHGVFYVPENKTVPESVAVPRQVVDNRVLAPAVFGHLGLAVLAGPLQRRVQRITPPAVIQAQLRRVAAQKLYKCNPRFRPSLADHPVFPGRCAQDVHGELAGQGKTNETFYRQTRRDFSHDLPGERK